MRNMLVIAGLMAGLFAGPALAADQPASSEACFAALDVMAKTAETGADAKNLDDVMIEKIGEMLTKLDSQCDSGQLKDAAATMTELEKVLK